MNMQMQPTWANWFVNQSSNDTGNQNLQAFSDTLGTDVSNKRKLKGLVEDIDTAILAADANRNVALFHFPKNFGGTRTCPINKVTCLIGFGNRATAVLLDLNSAFHCLQIRVPGVHKLAGFKAAEEVANLPAPDDNPELGFGARRNI